MALIHKVEGLDELHSESDEAVPGESFDSSGAWFEDEEVEEIEEEEYSLNCAHLGLREVTLKPKPQSSVVPKSIHVFSPPTGSLPRLEELNWTKTRNNAEEPCLVLPGLYLGTEEHAKQETLLQRIGVTHILAAHETAKRYFPKSFDYLILQVRDKKDENLAEYFKDAYQYIHNARTNNGTVFVHCLAGRSRSPSLIIAYLMQSELISFSEAFKRVLASKIDIQPNTGFLHQLRQHECALGITTKGQNTQKTRKNWKSENNLAQIPSPSASPPKMRGRTSNKSPKREMRMSKGS